MVIPAAAGLHELLLNRMIDDDNLPSLAKDLVLAAVEGDEQLDALLTGQPLAATAHEDPRTDAPQDVFLRSISVEGFRGVASRATLHLQPGPGLTVVAGRNGSGKSSFAEAAEMALTGDNERWRDKTAVWKKGWRNLHHAGPSTVEVEFVAENTSPTRITRSFTGDDLAAGSWFQQARGEKQQAYDAAQWRDELVIYRPFLPYSELGKLINSPPSQLHDSLYRLLGLDALPDAYKRLNDRDKQYRAEAKALREERKQLLSDCAELDDERAQKCAVLLDKTRPDLEAIANRVRGDDSDIARLTALRRITELTLPATQQITAAAEALTTTAAKHRSLSTAEATAAREIAELLRRGLAHHDTAGDGPCPVCGVGTLDTEWRERAEHTVQVHEQRAQELRDAHHAVTAAIADAHDLIQAIPQELRVEVHSVSTAATRQAWQNWHKLRALTDATELGVKLNDRHRALAEQLAKTQHAATTELGHRNETWQPLAQRLSNWHGRAARLQKQAVLHQQLSTAAKWLSATSAALRDERMVRFAEETQHVWSTLRQQSNVDLGNIQLAGGMVQRRVDLQVNIDGSHSEALSVMSQGELHALGLALFLPRATIDDSPFRFAVIDDPVQAMDPAKVDGLAQVLAETARTRQVIVFTHDARLTEAVRRLQLPATVWEVHRREKSEVELRKVDTPASRYLTDARALSKTHDMPQDLRAALIVNFCRSALDATSEMVFRARRLRRGDDHTSVDELLSNAAKTHDKLTLAVLDDPDKSGALYAKLRSASPTAVDTVQTCKKGAHRGYRGDLKELIRDTEKLVQWLERQ